MTKQFKTASVFGAAVLTLLAADGRAFAQSTLRRTAKDVGAITKSASRTHIESGTRSATDNRYQWSRRDSVGGRLPSAAHDRNAVDFVPNQRNVWTPDVHRDAASMARRLGSNRTVIVERPSSPISGHRYDQHTTYKVVPPLRGVQVNSYRVPQRATAPHIHVQGNYPRYVPPASRTRAPVYRSYSPSSSSRYYGSSRYSSSGGSRGAR
jgi:hypothetical protein